MDSPSSSISPLPNPKPDPQPLDHHPHPNPNPNPTPTPTPTPTPDVVENPTPLRQLPPDPADADLLAEYRDAAQRLLLSFADKLRRTGNGSTSTSTSTSSTAIIPFTSNPSTDLTLAAPTRDKKKHKKHSRSGEMVRVSAAEPSSLLLSRDTVRRTRTTFEALRSLLIKDADRADRAMPGLRSRPDLKAAVLMSQRGLWLNRDKRIIGAIPGIHVGDVFFYRWELCVVGIHGQNQAGIDYVAASQSANGEPIATSIVLSGGYEDDDDGGDVIIYTGQGGRERNLTRHSVDQKLESGNLALERSMNYGIEVRVIRGLKCSISPIGKVYVYDGLYNVVECWLDVGKSGFCVYKYKLVRIEGQVVMGSVRLKLAEDLKRDPLSMRPDGCLSLDMSKGKEKQTVLLFNDIDGDQEPLGFEYVARSFYTRAASHERKHGNRGGGCTCVSNCSTDCYCATRNGGEFAYDANGALLRGKPLIYECGSSCSCPPSCTNRVTQKGVRNRLEVFRSLETGWGVRSLDLIRAGAFICEFTGIVVTKQEAEALSENGASLIHSNSFPPRWLEWGDMSSVFPEYAPPDFPPLPELSFSIDVSRMRNVACYLSHSCSPNVFLQFVLFDHYNELYPHLMVFAMENIPPLRDLSIDYGVGLTGEEASLSY